MMKNPAVEAAFVTFYMSSLYPCVWCDLWKTMRKKSDGWSDDEGKMQSATKGETGRRDDETNQGDGTMRTVRMRIETSARGVVVIGRKVELILYFLLIFTCRRTVSRLSTST
jgi:hypothetical protein